MGSVEFLAWGRPGGDEPHVIYRATENNQGHIGSALSSGPNAHVVRPCEREAIRSRLSAAGLI
jgi:hypothetical protein